MWVMHSPQCLLFRHVCEVIDPLNLNLEVLDVLTVSRVHPGSYTGPKMIWANLRNQGHSLWVMKASQSIQGFPRIYSKGTSTLEILALEKNPDSFRVKIVRVFVDLK